jgi:hypothetical protein
MEGSSKLANPKSITEVIDLFEERAAIIEESGFQSHTHEERFQWRKEAEELAMADICKIHGSWYRIPIEDHLATREKML